MTPPRSNGDRLGRIQPEPRQEESVKPLELFFDLVFVFAITQVTTLIVADPTYRAILTLLAQGIQVTVFVTLVAFVLAPGMDAVRGRGLIALVAGDDSAMPATMLYPPIVSTTAVTFAMVLSVFKPWGRIRRSARAERITPAARVASAGTPR